MGPDARRNAPGRGAPTPAQTDPPSAQTDGSAQLAHKRICPTRILENRNIKIGEVPRLHHQATFLEINMDKSEFERIQVTKLASSPVAWRVQMDSIPQIQLSNRGPHRNSQIHRISRQTMLIAVAAPLQRCHSAGAFRANSVKIMDKIDFMS
jgi:hypothetical protein